MFFPNEILVIIFTLCPDDLQSWLETTLQNKNYTEALYLIQNLTYKPSEFFLIDNFINNAISQEDFFKVDFILKNIGKPSFECINTSIKRSSYFMHLCLQYNLFSKNDLLIIFQKVLNESMYNRKIDFNLLDSFIDKGLTSNSFIEKFNWIGRACCSGDELTKISFIEWLRANGFEMPQWDKHSWKNVFLQAARDSHLVFMQWILDKDLIERNCDRHELGVLKRYKKSESVAFIQQHLKIHKRQRM